ncbi:MAG TPA: hypothetical protein VFZ61_01575 [Polyangiales bacterium]
MHRLPALSLVLAIAAFWSQPVQADAVHAPPTAADTAKAAEAAPALSVAPEMKAAWALQRRGRVLVALGLGSIVSSAVYLAWASQTGPCSDEAAGLRQGDAIAVGIVGGVGIGLSVGGGVAWGLGARRAKQAASAWEKARAALLAVGAAAITQTVLTIGRLGAAGFCAS